MKRLTAALFLIWNSAFAATLETDSYTVTITNHCDEGSVSCEKVSYQGISKKSGSSISLQGKTLHQTCADGISPCRFLGYHFKNGNINYYVYESGLLQVVREPREILIEEQGSWSYE